MNTTYAVWVGGIADYFDDETAAKEAAEMWLEDGYDDVQIQIITGAKQK